MRPYNVTGLAVCAITAGASVTPATARAINFLFIKNLLGVKLRLSNSSKHTILLGSNMLPGRWVRLANTLVATSPTIVMPKSILRSWRHIAKFRALAQVLTVIFATRKVPCCVCATGARISLRLSLQSHVQVTNVCLQIAMPLPAPDRVIASMLLRQGMRLRHRRTFFSPLPHRRCHSPSPPLCLLG